MIDNDKNRGKVILNYWKKIKDML